MGVRERKCKGKRDRENWTERVGESKTERKKIRERDKESGGVRESGRQKKR